MKQLELTVLLCTIWALTLLYGEMFAYWVPSLFTCSWPHLLRSPPSNSTSQTNSEGYQADYVKVAIIADPQLMDKTSLGLPPKSLALEIAEFYTDINMRRSFFASILPFKPDVIIFLGDYFDGGPYLSDEEWQESLRRFKHIFGLNEQGKYADMQVYYIPGNHDIGYSSLHSQRPEVIRRYEETFGIRNYRFSIGEVDFIAVDAQTLDGHPQKQLTSETWLFAKNVSIDGEVHPRVLLIHIPLYRRDDTYCGPDRSSPSINQRVSRTAIHNEITYQNYVSEMSSKNLLDMTKPMHILSGHDHDQCTVTHQSKFGPVKEHTLGTISWQQGNLYPSFMLLSVRNSSLPDASSSEDALLTQLCFLPMQARIYIWYLVLFALTILALLFWPTSGTSLWHQCGNSLGYTRQLLTFNLFGGATKEKDEDANYEYEMMWDAEGSMHLVKKPLSASIVNSSERKLGERGNAVMRPTARKQTSPEGDVSLNVDMASGIGFDPTARIPPRLGKSKTKFIIQRLLRALKILIVIAAVNVPLYMMLLFKDWIDK
ncbi:hypothetical protein L6164_004123 [Bauhinia variegata]|uniref:Uncharacterized protein n=1 Tax=Bauhinia variegata TaxID=167791 RepID=A0ACB9Q3I5_BAUVA|nr:hypothetical protein L6164_004123 [Bauhinia variegata]